MRLDLHRQLLNGSRLVHIGGKALDILSVLAAAGGRVVNKDELMTAVWPNAIVEENAIHVHVSAARRALGPEARRLATVWGRGYRLDAAPGDLSAGHGGASGSGADTDAEVARLVQQAQGFAGRVTPASLLRAIDLLEQAIARDPGCRTAWTGLAGTLMVAIVAGVLPSDRRGSARAMAEQAIRIDNCSGAPCAIRAVLDTGECRWIEAAAGFRLAAERSPDDPVILEAALLLWLAIGHVGRATGLAEGAVRAAPASPNFALSRAHVALVADDLTTAAAQLENATLLGLSEDRVVARVLRVELALAAGDCAGAADQMAALFASALPPRDGSAGAPRMISEALLGSGDAALASGSIVGLVDHAPFDALGRAQMLLGQLINWHVRLGALDAAFDLANRMVETYARSGSVAVRAMHQWWRADMAPFREDDRFARLTARLGLSTAWVRLGHPEGHAAVERRRGRTAGSA